MDNNVNNYGQQPNEPVIAPGYQQNNNSTGYRQNNMNTGYQQNNMNAGYQQNNMNTGYQQNNVSIGYQQNYMNGGTMQNNMGSMQNGMGVVQNNMNMVGAQPVNGYANGVQGQNPAAGTRIYNFVHRKMKGQEIVLGVSMVLAVIIGLLIVYSLKKAFPDFYYDEKRIGQRVVRSRSISGSFCFGAIGGAFVGFFYVLFVSLFVAASGKEANGGSFYMDDLFINYSVRAAGIRKATATLTINGVPASISNSDERDKAYFLPILKNNDKKSLKKYRFYYYVTMIRGRVIRISTDGKTIYFGGTKVIDNKQQIVAVLPPLQGAQYR